MSFYLSYSFPTGTARREIATAAEALAAYREILAVGAEFIEMRDQLNRLLSLEDLIARSVEARRLRP